MTINLPRGNEVDLGQRCPGNNKSSCEHEVMLALGQSLPRGSSLSRVHENRPLKLEALVDTDLRNVFCSLGYFKTWSLRQSLLTNITASKSRQIPNFIVQLGK